MQEQLEKYLQQLVETLKEGGQFAMEQLPLFVQEYLDFYALFHGFWTFIGFIVLTAYLVFYVKYNKKHAWDDDIMFGTTMIGIIVCLVSGITFVVNLLQFFKVIIAPRVYLIENLTNLL